MILITGATGFLGSELVVQLLKVEQKVKCIRRKSSVIPEILLSYKDKIEWIYADLLDFADLELAFSQVDVVYHCAAIISFNSNDSKRIIHNNTEATGNIVNLCLKYKVSKLIHVSSIAALGRSKYGELITEDHYWDAFEIHNSYAISKYLSEMEVWRGIEEGLIAVIVNPSVIIGIGTGWEGSGLMFKTIKQGLKYYTNGSIGLVDVFDVAQCMIKLQKLQSAENKRYIINSVNLTYREIFTKIATALNVNAPKIQARPWMLKIALELKSIKNLFAGKNMSLNKDIIESAFLQQNYSNEKISILLNYNFKSIDNSIIEIANGLQLKSGLK